MREDWLRSAVGERASKQWSGGRKGAHSGLEAERNAAAEPQTEAAAYGGDSDECRS